jgi:uncharacterized membrane protein YphA (DoxX/SURF4 family)
MSPATLEKFFVMTTLRAAGSRCFFPQHVAVENKPKYQSVICQIPLPMKRIAINIVAVLLIILFVHAGLIKWLDYTTFKNQLSVYPLLSPFAGVIAWLFPAMELFVACLLISGRARTLGLSLSVGLMTLLSGYIIFLLNTGYNVPCACETLLGFTSWPAQLKFNLVFLLVALSGLLLQLLAVQEGKMEHFTAVKA